MPRLGDGRAELRVVPDNSGPRWNRTATIVDLARHPFRPGETPTLVTLRLAGRDQQLVEDLARRARLPAPLAARIGGEASRCVSEAAALLGRPTEVVRAACELQLEDAPDGSVLPLTRATLGNYADMVDAGDAPGQVAETLPLRLSDEMYGAWTTAAINSRMPLERWLMKLLACVPSNFVAYEVAAARASRTLAEWVYAASLSAAASSID